MEFQNTNIDDHIIPNSQQTKIIKLHQNYQISQKDQIAKNIDKLMQLYKNKQKNKNQQKIYSICEFSYFPTFQFKLQRLQKIHQKCCICQQQYQYKDFQNQLLNYHPEDIVALEKCTHMFHKFCLQNLANMNSNNWIKCPVCSTIYGKMIGDQPQGKFSRQVIQMNCQGYNCGTIVITYCFSGGIRNGKKFYGTTRQGYLPNNQEGKQVAKLLKQAFDRKLVFTIGRSVTTGQQNAIVWNGIHHKTSLSGGSAYFGYPDNTYLRRVKQQLAAKGIF